MQELQNAVECGVVLGDGARIRLADLPAPIQTFAQVCGGGMPSEGPAREGRDELTERRAIVQAMETARGDASEVARLLGMNRRTLAYHIASFGLEAELTRSRSPVPQSPATGRRQLAMVRPKLAEVPAAGLREC